MEAEKPRVRSPCASSPWQQGSLSIEQQPQSGLTRYDSSTTLHAQAHGGSHTVATVLQSAHENRTVGYFPRQQQIKSVCGTASPLPKSAPAIGAVRLGTGSTSIPAPIRTATSPRHVSSPPRRAAPPQVSKCWSPPPLQAVAVPVTLSAVRTPIVRSPTLSHAPTATGNRSVACLGVAHCGGSLGAAIGGAAVAAQYQCTSMPVLRIQPQERRVVVSPRF